MHCRHLPSQQQGALPPIYFLRSYYKSQVCSAHLLLAAHCLATPPPASTPSPQVRAWEALHHSAQEYYAWFPRPASAAVAGVEGSGVCAMLRALVDACIRWAGGAGTGVLLAGQCREHISAGHLFSGSKCSMLTRGVQLMQPCAPGWFGTGWAR